MRQAVHEHALGVAGVGRLRDQAPGMAQLADRRGDPGRARVIAHGDRELSGGHGAEDAQGLQDAPGAGDGAVPAAHRLCDPQRGLGHRIQVRAGLVLPPIVCAHVTSPRFTARPAAKPSKNEIVMGLVPT